MSTYCSTAVLQLISPLAQVPPVVFASCESLFFYFLSYRDSDRKRKVKELMGSLATQEGEWKALKRKKRK